MTKNTGREKCARGADTRTRMLHKVHTNYIHSEELNLLCGEDVSMRYDEALKVYDLHDVFAWAFGNRERATRRRIHLIRCKLKKDKRALRVCWLPTNDDPSSDAVAIRHRGGGRWAVSASGLVCYLKLALKSTCKHTTTMTQLMLAWAEDLAETTAAAQAASLSATDE